MFLRRDVARNSFARLLSVAFIACTFLAACGGGGGGGGSPTPPGGPGGESLASREFPDQFTATFPEATGSFANSATTFSFTAPTDDLPTNVVLTGADAQFFAVIIAATAPNTSGVRSITVTIQRVLPLNFENPADDNKDNVYRFRLSGVYRGETLSADVVVTITDIGDAAEAVATVIHGDAVGQFFGLPISAMPDVTGDGRPEIAASIQSGRGTASGFIVGSEVFSAMPGGKLPIANLGANGSRFPQTAAVSIGVAPTANLITSQPSSAGVDILLSDAAQNKFYLFQLSGAGAFNTLRGAVNPATVPNTIVYSFPGGAPTQEGRLIGDVNGDGLNDIFVRKPSADGSGGMYGIILGRAVTSPADLQRAATFDISLTYASESASGTTVLHTTVTQLLSDLDGDGHKDLVISWPNHTSNSDMWVIRSSVLRSAVPVSVNLDSLTSGEGVRLANKDAFNFIEIGDLDNDGYQTLLIPIGFGNAIAVDANELLNLPVGLPSGTIFGPSATIIHLNSLRFLSDAGDIDGDGIKDFLGSFGSTGYFVRGAGVRAMIQSGASTVGATMAIEMPPLSNSAAFGGREPVMLGATTMGQNGLIAFGMANFSASSSNISFSVDVGAGSIVLVKPDDIRRAMTTPGATGLTLRLN